MTNTTSFLNQNYDVQNLGVSDSAVAASASSPFQLDPNWCPIPARREDRGRVKVVWLQGTPYEMGYQHGMLLHDEIACLPRWFIRALNLASTHLGLGQFARRRSFQAVIDECAGLAAATADLGFTVESCLAIAFGDVFQQLLRDSIPMLLGYQVDLRDVLPALELGCSQMVAAGSATVDGRLYHGDSLDCPRQPMSYWLNHPTVFVRQPHDGIPHVAIAVPGAVWPNSGLNAAGISLALNTVRPARFGELTRSGCSHVQMMAQILKYATSYAAARSFISAQPQMKSDLILVADGSTQQAGVFEMTGRQLTVRELDATGVLYATNHFVTPEMQHRGRLPTRSSQLRYQRYQQLLEPGACHSRHGQIDAQVMVEMLRDRIHPQTLQESPLGTYDDNLTLATNGALRQVVFDPARLNFWLATGNVPVPANPFVGFSLGELLELPNAIACPSLP